MENKTESIKEKAEELKSKAEDVIDYLLKNFEVKLSKSLYLSMAEVVKQSGRTWDFIRTAVKYKLIKLPEKRPGMVKPHWLKTDLPELLEQLNKCELPSKSKVRRDLTAKYKEGLFSSEDLAKSLGVCRITIEHHIKRGNIKQPTRKIKELTGHYWNKKEVEVIKKWWNSKEKQQATVALDYETKKELIELAKENEQSVALFVKGLVGAYKQYKKEKE